MIIDSLKTSYQVIKHRNVICSRKDYKNEVLRTSVRLFY